MKKFARILTASLLVLSIAGCSTPASSGGGGTPTGGGGAPSGGGSGDGTVQVGIVLPTKDEPRWMQDQTRFSEGLTQAGFTNQVSFSQGDSGIERSNVETLVQKGAKVIIICPQDGNAAAAAVEVAKESGATVIAYDRVITNTDKLDYFVGFDSENVGKAQADYLISQTTGAGNPLYLYAGSVSDENAFNFFNGAWKELQPKIADGTYVIVNSSEATALSDKNELAREDLAKILGQISIQNWDLGLAKGKAETDLIGAPVSSKGNVFILAPNDGTARNIADAFAADSDILSYKITGQDVEIPSIQYIIQGKQSMSVFKDTRALTNAAIQMATDILGGNTPTTTGTVNNGAIEVPSDVLEVQTVTVDNYKEILVDSGYYQEDQLK
ncbi:sugar ABC transporter substrate-binding protein [Clostridia bacterium]|nr:sugar ABC transporter substrate-binding protein [Clostridia bacterium]